MPAAERAGIAAAHELANPEYALDSISRTFHGRDLFAPAAAHLARGVALEELGPPLGVDALVRLDLPEPEVGQSRIAATILYVDNFGNIALNLTREHVDRVGIVPGTQVELELGGERVFAVAARTFADARVGDIILYEDSYRNMSVAISGGNAAELLSATPARAFASTSCCPEHEAGCTGAGGLRVSAHKDVRGTVSPARTSFFRARAGAIPPTRSSRRCPAGTARGSTGGRRRSRST